MTTRIAPTPLSPYVLKTGRFSSHSLLLDALPPDGHGRRLLDVGGGEGFLSRLLAERGYRVTCIARPDSRADDFPAAVDLLGIDLDFDLPRFDRPFDFILCGDILEHLREPAAVLRWLRRHLAPGGLLVASLPNSAHLYFRLNVLLGRFPEHGRGLFDRTHLHFYAWNNWRRVIDEGGFRIETVRPTAAPVELLMPARRSGLALGALERLSYGLARLWGNLFAYQFVITARPAEEY